ncbi:MAG: signal peptidase II [Chloroflexota bacterium]|nr:signal peptidase II [Chloroflexota bacterium]
MTPSTFHRFKWLRLIVTVALVLFVDQVSKAWVIASIPYQTRITPIPALADFFEITHTRNSGAAFGFLSGAGWLFLVIALAVSVGMIAWYPRVRPGAVVTQIALGLVMAGALGNAIDRLRYDAVIDFIHYTLPGVISNVSNLADHAIVGGVIVLVLQSWRVVDPAKETVDEITNSQ